MCHVEVLHEYVVYQVCSLYLQKQAKVEEPTLQSALLPVRVWKMVWACDRLGLEQYTSDKLADMDIMTRWTDVRVGDGLRVIYHLSVVLSV